MYAKKILKCLSIVVGLSAVWLISGCSHDDSYVPMSTNPSITIPVEHSYPQMYTKDMLDVKDSVEKDFNVTFLGCYDNTEGEFLIWVWDNESGICEASVVGPGTDIKLRSCEDGWEVYRAVCLEVGNCV